MLIEYIVMSISEFRKNMKEGLNWLQDGDRVRAVTIAKHSKIVAYLVSPPLYQSLLNAKTALDEMAEEEAKAIKAIVEEENKRYKALGIEKLIPLEKAIAKDWEVTEHEIYDYDENEKGGIDE